MPHTHSWIAGLNGHGKIINPPPVQLTGDRQLVKFKGLNRRVNSEQPARTWFTPQKGLGGSRARPGKGKRTVRTPKRCSTHCWMRQQSSGTSRRSSARPAWSCPSRTGGSGRCSDSKQELQVEGAPRVTGGTAVAQAMVLTSMQSLSQVHPLGISPETSSMNGHVCVQSSLG